MSGILWFLLNVVYFVVFHGLNPILVFCSLALSPDLPAIQFMVASVSDQKHDSGKGYNDGKAWEQD